MASKKIKLGMSAILLVFGMAFAGCDTDAVDSTVDEPTSDGYLTVTGIPSRYNGYFAFFVAENDYLLLIGTENYVLDTNIATRRKISGGSVTLPMWNVDYDNNKMIRFFGNTTFSGDATTGEGGSGLIIHNEQISRWDCNDTSVTGRQWISDVTFTNGSSTASWGAGIPWGN